MDKKERIIDSLVKEKVDALLCFLPENILFLSGYWPNTGHSAILFPVEGEPLMIVPRPDLKFIHGDWKGDVLDYGVGLDDEPPAEKLATLLRDSFAKRGFLKSRVGCERSFEAFAGTHIGGEVTAPGRPLFSRLEAAMPEVAFDCQTVLIQKLRMRKTEQEIEGLRVCHDIAGYALGEAKTQLREGMKETELAAIIESAILTYGVGHAGVSRARGFAFVVSGPNTEGVYAWGPYNISTDRVLQQGDLVLIELDAYAEGYWVDLTRTFVVGEANHKQQEIMGVILETIDTVVEALEPGMKASVVDEIARNSIIKAGYGDYFPHNIGHGVGFAFHEMPYLRRASDSVIEPGMVLAIEPGIYIPGWGGIRVEDNIAMTEHGKSQYLSTIERGF